MQQVTVTQVLTFLELNHENWQKHHGYDEIDDIGQIAVSIRWVVSHNYEVEDVTYKARLVDQGFEEENLDEICKDSPTCCKNKFCVP